MSSTDIVFEASRRVTAVRDRVRGERERAVRFGP